MKLYGTMTSERASESQGGNKELVSVFTVESMGKRVEVVRVHMEYDAKEGYRIIVHMSKHQSTETVLEMNEWHNLYSIEERVREDQKGNKQ